MTAPPDTPTDRLTLTRPQTAERPLPMIRLSALATAAALVAGLMFAAPAPAPAQGLFSPKVIVNDRAVTVYEYEQRLRMLTLFGASGDAQQEALNGLIDDRLRRVAADQLGLSVTPEQITAGVAEFAGRVNMSGDQFLAELNRAGVATETFRDFVTAGVLWREVVRARFLPQVNISEADIDKALASTPPDTSGTRVQISEIVIREAEGDNGAAFDAVRRIRATLTDADSFANAARRYSSSNSGPRGGQLNWVASESLPPAVASALRGLSPGQISQPVRLPNAAALYLLQGRDGSGDRVARIDYAEFLIAEGPGTAAEVERIRQGADTCMDLNRFARGLPVDQLRREQRPMAQIPADVAAELARLDDNEISANIVRGGTRVLVMLCARNWHDPDKMNRDAIREQLLNRRLAGMAELFLADLRANAIIRQP